MGAEVGLGLDVELEVLHAVNVDVDAGSSVGRRRERQRVLLLVLLAVQLEALLASGRVDDLARRAAAGGRVGARRLLGLVVRRVGNLGLDEVGDSGLRRGGGEAAKGSVLWKSVGVERCDSLG